MSSQYACKLLRDTLATCPLTPVRSQKTTGLANGPSWEIGSSIATYVTSHNTR
jgi:hypothetical protein